MVRAWLRRALWEMVPRDHRQTTEALRRRQWVTIAFVLLGGTLLGFSIRIEPGSGWFYVATIALATIWTVGAFASGPLYLGQIAHSSGLRRPVLSPILIGLLMVAVFLLGALAVRENAFLNGQVQDVLDHAVAAAWPLMVFITAINGLAEELFFRGAAYAATTRYPVPVTTLAYGVATVATGNVMLVFAALVIGLVVGLERRASGGILAPILTHVTWSLAMLTLLPLVFG